MKILVTGSSGMLGNALCKELSAKHEVIGMDVNKLTAYGLELTAFLQCDITDSEQTSKAVVAVKPDTVIHAAAYTDVDGCEANPQKAEAVNALGAANIAKACRQTECLLLYVSTDFIFDGKKQSAYLESDRPNPINVYGRSKLEGERLIKSVLERYLIVRSSWLFGRGGKNFVDTILERAKTAGELKVVADQRGSPTYTNDLAQAIEKMLAMAEELEGIYHITNSDSCSRCEFAQAIKELAGLSMVILPIRSAEYPAPAHRPVMSILENRRYQELNHGEKLRPWREALEEYLDERNQIGK